jgi:hypothetical protein
VFNGEGLRTRPITLFPLVERTIEPLRSKFPSTGDMNLTRKTAAAFADQRCLKCLAVVVATRLQKFPDHRIRQREIRPRHNPDLFHEPGKHVGPSSSRLGKWKWPPSFQPSIFDDRRGCALVAGVVVLQACERECFIRNFQGPS